MLKAEQNSINCSIALLAYYAFSPSLMLAIAIIMTMTLRVIASLRTATKLDRPERWIVTIPSSDQWLATIGNHWKTIATNGFGDQKPLKNHC